MAQTSQRGFASWDPDDQRRAASEGGRAAHDSGHAHEWDSSEAAEAGHRGGIAAHHRAAFHHETAAHHHTQAARHYSAGRYEQGDLHSESAGTHGRHASEYNERARSGRGFASMDPERRRELAAEGGRASHGGNGAEEESDYDEKKGRGRNNEGDMRGGSREQHAEAGRQGGRSRSH
jgi:general stress protein YciG